jgi:hypothetical protein
MSFIQSQTNSDGPSVSFFCSNCHQLDLLKPTRPKVHCHTSTSMRTLLEFTDTSAFSELIINAAEVASLRIQTDGKFFDETIGNVLRKVAVDSNLLPPTLEELAAIRENLHCVVELGADRNSYMQCLRDENKILVNDTARHLESIPPV